MNHSKLVSVALKEQFISAVYVRLASISQMSQITVDEHPLRQLALDFPQQLTPAYEIVPPQLVQFASITVGHLIYKVNQEIATFHNLVYVVFCHIRKSQHCRK